MVSDLGASVLPPNALDSWTEVARRFERSAPAVFLDYDGTLTPLVDDPKKATLSTEMRRTLERLAARLPVVLVSGRDLQVLISLVAIDGLIYAGSHGFDISGPDGLRHQVASECIPLMKDAAAQLRHETSQIAGAIIEHKRIAVAVHYRMVAEAEVADVIAAVDRLVSREPRLTARHGKKILEVQPAVDWDKGKAVNWIGTRMAGEVPMLPVYLGDDVTDEDAFAGIGDRGVSIVIGQPDRPTHAQYSLRDTNEVKTFLDQLAARRSLDERGVQDMLNVE